MVRQKGNSGDDGGREREKGIIGGYGGGGRVGEEGT